jgi:hypothetical protein
VGAGLYSLGIHIKGVLQYEAALKAGQFLLIAHGTATEVAQAKAIIDTTHPAQCTLHAAEAEHGQRSSD